jgi:hypothetical protein
MSTLTAPTIQPWPRAAMAACLLLAVALAVTIALAVTAARHTAIRTVFQQVPALDQPLACRVGHPC